VYGRGVRALLFASLVACSTPAKPAAESPPPPAGSAAPDPTTPPTTGSATDPWHGQPEDPAADLALLRADVDIICSAAKVTGGKSWMEVGPHIAENMKTMHKIGLFADVRTTTLDEFIERIRGLMAKASVTKCDTVDVLIANDPRSKR
jgi:hypothetical protein